MDIDSSKNADNKATSRANFDYWMETMFDTKTLVEFKILEASDNKNYDAGVYH
jgi:hypothetical protein